MATFRFVYPKESSNSAELRKRFKKFRDTQKAPALASLPKSEIHKPAAVKGIHLHANDVKILHNIASSTSPLTDAIANQKATPDQIIGTLSTSLVTLDFIKMEAEYKKRLSAAKNDSEKKTLNSRWQEGVKAFKLAYSSIGLKNIDEKNMRRYSAELLRDKKAFNSVVNIANSKQAVKGFRRSALNTKSVAAGNFETYVGKIDDALIGNIILPGNLCSRPLVQGSFTKHFGHSFSLKVTISLPCITGWKWGFIPIFGWCKHTYTIAGLSYNVDLNVGYKVTCCGGEAWGVASANVCATLLGITFCAGCSASIIGVAGIARTPSGGNCIYGLGLKAELKCTFAGITVLDVVVPFGYTLTGPCPPLPCVKTNKIFANF
jgi:hypothetical protein